MPLFNVTLDILTTYLVQEIEADDEADAIREAKIGYRVTHITEEEIVNATARELE